MNFHIGHAVVRDLHHLAFKVPTLAQVIAARDRLRACGAVIAFSDAPVIEREFEGHSAP